MISSCGNSSQQPASPTLLGNKQWWSQGKKVRQQWQALHFIVTTVVSNTALQKTMMWPRLTPSSSLLYKKVQLGCSGKHCIVATRFFASCPLLGNRAGNGAKQFFLQNESVPVCWGPDTVAADGWSFISTCGKLVLKHLATLSDMIHAQYMAT